MSDLEDTIDPTIQLPDANNAPGAHLPPEQIALRDRFIQQYVIDYDAVEATMRIGYSRDVAMHISRQFLNCEYVAFKIQKWEDENDGDLDIEQRRIFAALRKESRYYGPGSSHAARVAALAKLASLRKMDQPIKHEHDVNSKGGVMVVPGVASVDDWQRAAIESQKALTDNA